MAQPQQLCTDDSFSWAFNDEGQSPCIVASLLARPCEFNAPPLQPLLPSGPTYPPPSDRRQNACLCSGAVYALTSACAACQGTTYNDWSHWTSACSSSVSGYSQIPPVGTRIPGWALREDVIVPTLNLQAAQRLAQTPDGPGPGPSIGTLNSTNPTTSLPSSTVSNTTTSTSTSTVSLTSTVQINPTNVGFGSDALPSKTDGASSIPPTANPAAAGNADTKASKGPMVGGIVGGIALVAIIGGILAWWAILRRRQARIAPSAAYIASYGDTRTGTSMSVRPYPDYSNSPFLDRVSDENKASSGYHPSMRPTSAFDYTRGPTQQYGSTFR